MKHMKLMDDMIEGVKAFMRKAGQDVPTKLTLPDDQTIILRRRLIEEELREYTDAVQKLVAADSEEAELNAMVDVADAIADLHYVVAGAAIACGLPMAEIQAIVQEANMTKFSLPGGYRREDGKWMKPPGWQPPEPKIKELLKTMLKAGLL